jgi:transcriptional regulator with XRE-family HTH domain
MTGKELAYLLEKTGTSGKDFAEATGINPSSITNYKKVKCFRNETEQLIFGGFRKLGYESGEITQLLKQRFENERKTPLPPSLMSDPHFDTMLRLSYLQAENNQLKSHIEALELNVKLLTEKLDNNV